MRTYLTLLVLVAGMVLRPFFSLAQSTEPRCMFPGPWQVRDESLKVIDAGHMNPVLLAQYGGDAENFHPYGMMGDPFILFDGAKFRMWFTSAADMEGSLAGFAYSESDDGLLWTDPKAANPDKLMAMRFETELDDWDAGGMETNAVLYRPDTQTYTMFYAGIYDEDAYAVGMATSPDGLDWQKHPAPVLPALYDWEQPILNLDGRLVGGTMEPSVIYDAETGVFHLWYSALGMIDGVWGGRIGYATSRDGIVWKRLPHPVFEPGEKDAWDAAWVSHSHVIADPNYGFHLFYAGESADSLTYAIGHAYSPDGVNWTRHPDNPILSNAANTWYSSMVGGPSPLFHEGQIRLYFMGAENRDFAYVHFGLTTGICE